VTDALERWIRDQPHEAALQHKRLQQAVKEMMPWWHSYKRSGHREHWTECQLPACKAYRQLVT
jgi:muramidase (phage lysozyme)